MALAGRLLKSGSAIIIAQGCVMSFTMARNVLLARMLGPEQFGIAATYAVVMGFVQASFEFGPDKYILQAPEGGSAKVLGAVHAFTLARGLCSGIALFILAEPIAVLFHVPDLAWAYRTLALAPIIRGFIHFDFRRQQRDLSYRQEIIITLASATAAFAAAVIVAEVETSHVAMLASLIVQATTMVALSFVLATIPYRIRTAGSEIGALFRFGWPLVVNSLVIVAAMQGDRALVGGVFGPKTLAVYATAAILAGAPYLIVVAPLGRTMMPVLAPLRGKPLFATRYEHFGATITLLVIAIFVPVALIGGFIIPIVFGSAYRPDPLVIAGLAAAGGVSLMRAWTNIAALSVGNSKATLYTNCVRLSGLLLAAIGVLAGGGLAVIVMALLAGELTALAFALLRTHGINGLPAARSLTFIVPTVAVLVASLLLSREAYALGWANALLITLVLQLLSFSILVIASRTIRTVIAGIFSMLYPRE